MPDFSHLRRLPLTSFLPALKPGKKLSAEFFDHLLERIEPALLPEPQMQALRAELCWFAPKPYKTRPPKGLSRAELAAAIRSVDRPDIPAPLLKCLFRELNHKAPVDRLAAPRRQLQERRRRDRLFMMAALHRVFTDYLERGIWPTIPKLAERVKDFDNSACPRTMALELTIELMRDLKLDPPSIGRLRNIICDRKRATAV